MAANVMSVGSTQRCLRTLTNLTGSMTREDRERDEHCLGNLLLNSRFCQKISKGLALLLGHLLVFYPTRTRHLHIRLELP